MNQSVFDKLVATARAGAVITYTDLARVADVEVGDEQGLTRLGQILDEIAMEDVTAGRPLLAAVVVRSDSGAPSSGFYKFAKKHRLMKGNDEVSFWAGELKKLYSLWQSSR